MAKSLTAQFNQTDIDLTPNPILPDISDGIQQTLTRLLIWDDTNQRWARPQLSNDGKLLVETGSGSVDTAVQATASIGTSSAAVLSTNANRKAAVIQNLSSNTIYLGFGIPATQATGLALLPSQSFTIDFFTGVINAIAATSGNDVNIIEF